MRRPCKTRRAPRLWHLAEVMRERNVGSVSELQALLSPHVGFTYFRTRRLVVGDFSNALETLDALCYVLRCDVSDIVRISYGEGGSTAQPTMDKQARRRKPRRPDAVRRLKPLGDPSGVVPISVNLSGMPRAKT